MSSLLTKALVFLLSLMMVFTSRLSSSRQFQFEAVAETVEDHRPVASAVFVLGDSSVDCGENSFFYPLLHTNLSTNLCNGSDETLLPGRLAEKMGLPTPTAFYALNGTIEGVLDGLSFASAHGTIMNLNGYSHQSMHQQFRQVSETFQLLQLHLGPDDAYRFIKSSVFFISFGKDDYIDLLFEKSPSMDSKEFARILANQMSNLIRDLYDTNVRKMVCLGVLPLGCSPRVVWRWSNRTDGRGCVEETNELVSFFNDLLESRIAEMRSEFGDADIVFCDVFQGLMEIISRPDLFGFENVSAACCGVGWNGGMGGCNPDVLPRSACRHDSSHVWWDFCNPTKAVNALLADSAWSGLPLPEICRPVTVGSMLSSSPS